MVSRGRSRTSEGPPRLTSPAYPPVAMSRSPSAERGDRRERALHAGGLTAGEPREDGGTGPGHDRPTVPDRPDVALVCADRHRRGLGVMAQPPDGVLQEC